MRVLFYYRGIENMGVGYCMSMLKSHGHEIDLIFDPGLDDNLFIKFPQLAWVNRHEALLERAVGFRPDLIAMGCPTNLYPFARKMAEKLREKLPEVPILMGGHHAQALPEYVLENPHIDMVCTGEGEIAILELVSRMERGEDYTDVPTLWVKKDGVVHRNPIGPLENDLDRFPFPEKQLWWDYGCFRDNLEVFTGRGCPFKCTFCNIHYQREIFKDRGNFLRKRSLDSVMAELKQNVAKYDVRYVSVHDDNFTTNPKYVEEFCERYRREINLPWYCFGYPTTLRPKLVRAMKAANCHTIFMGVDSGDPDVRRHMMERPMTDDLIRNAAKTVLESGIGLQASCIYGNPGESPEQMFKTLAMIDEIKPTQASAYVFYPFPKTKMYQASVDLGYLDEEGEQKVRDGISGYHHESVLKHPHKELAETRAKITPVYARSPELLKPAIRWIIRRRMKRVALALYVLLIPLTFPYLGVEGIRVTLRMAYQALAGRPAESPGAEPTTSPSCTTS